MAFIRTGSIQRKLTLVIFFASVLGLSITCLALELYERASFRTSMTTELAFHAEMLELNTAASITFNDRKSAQNILAALQAEPHIVAACIYDNHGNIFAEYRREGLGENFKMPVFHEDGTRFEPEAVTLYHRFHIDDEKVGSVAIASDFSELRAKMKQFREISALVLLVSILVMALVSHRLVRLITEPILQLAAVAGKVSADKNYALRGISQGDDEVGALVSSFNQMLEQIPLRRRMLPQRGNSEEPDWGSPSQRASWR
jgi:methyl-accepting chemotaxis protein